jgi:hypothetical protein
MLPQSQSHTALFQSLNQRRRYSLHTSLKHSANFCFQAYPFHTALPPVYIFTENTPCLRQSGYY